MMLFSHGRNGGNEDDEQNVNDPMDDLRTRPADDGDNRSDQFCG